jgi:hypothetical protein
MPVPGADEFGIADGGEPAGTSTTYTLKLRESELTEMATPPGERVLRSKPPQKRPSCLALGASCSAHTQVRDLNETDMKSSQQEARNPGLGNRKG